MPSKIDLLIEADAPHWVVISNDMRLHEAARRRGSESWSLSEVRRLAHR